MHIKKYALENVVQTILKEWTRGWKLISRLQNSRFGKHVDEAM